MGYIDTKYELLAEIGQGISGSVFQAKRKADGKVVVIKRLNPTSNRYANPRYLIEWEQIVQLNHPTIIKAIEHIEEDNEKYLISEFVTGLNLYQLIMQKGAIQESLCARIMINVCEGLREAHHHKLFHLNLKPQNIFVFLENLSSPIIARFGDFGLWTTGLDEGPHGNFLAFFKAPEQRRGVGIGPASDIYALGKLMYVMLAGDLTPKITPEALPPNTPFQAIIYRCIRTNIGDRFSSVDELIAQLEPLVGSFSTPSSSVTPKSSSPTTSHTSRQQILSSPTPHHNPQGESIKKEGKRRAAPSYAALDIRSSAREETSLFHDQVEVTRDGDEEQVVPPPTAAKKSLAPPPSLIQPDLQVEQDSGPVLGNVTPQQRVVTEVQGLLLAARKQLTNLRLETCEEVVSEAKNILRRYASLHDPRWLASIERSFKDVEDELANAKSEVEKLTKELRNAIDHQDYYKAKEISQKIREISLETSTADPLIKEVELVINKAEDLWKQEEVLWGNQSYEQVLELCEKILALIPAHPKACQRLQEVKLILRKKRRIKLLLMLIPIFLLVLGIIGLTSYLYYNYQQTIQEFEQARQKNAGEKAELLAQQLVGKPDIWKKLIGDYIPAQTYLETRHQSQILLGSALTAKQRIENLPPAKLDADMKIILTQASNLIEEAKQHISAGRHHEAIELFNKSIQALNNLYISVQKSEIQQLMKDEKWQDAFNLIQDVLSLVPHDEDLKKWQEETKSYLTPGLILVTYWQGKPIDGALILINNENKGYTPKRIDMEKGKVYKLTVLMPPRENHYFKPFSQEYSSQETVTQTLNIELETIPGPIRGKVWSLDTINLTMVSILPNTFEMGSSLGSIWEQPVHLVKISYHFWMADSEITHAQYARVMGKKDPPGELANIPVTNISWDEAMAFCHELTKQEILANRLPVGYVYRLPTEAEWECCARAGAKEVLGPQQLGEFAWTSENSENQMRPIGKKLPNAWKLYDFLGNAREWCFDKYNKATYIDRKGITINPLGPTGGRERVVRGGSYLMSSDQCLVYRRMGVDQNSRAQDLGFRIVLAPNVDLIPKLPSTEE